MEQADPDVQPFEQGLLGHDHRGLPPDRAAVLGFADHDLAVERVGIVGGLDLDQRAFAAGNARHGAQARRFRHLPHLVERRALVLARPAMHALEGEIAADKKPPLAGERLVEGGAERSDGRDGGDAERDAGDEDDESASARSQLAKRDR